MLFSPKIPRQHAPKGRFRAGEAQVGLTLARMGGRLEAREGDMEKATCVKQRLTKSNLPTSSRFETTTWEKRGNQNAVQSWSSRFERS